MNTTTATPAQIDTELVDVNAEIAATVAKLESLKAQAEVLNAEHARRPWNRFFVVANGHIHSGSTCKGGTIGVQTAVAWRTELSGKTIAEAVAELGAALCTHCFPEAPVALTTTPAKVNPNRCGGTGQFPVEGTTRFRMNRVGECSVCHTEQIVKDDLRMRAHNKPKGS